MLSNSGKPEVFSFVSVGFLEWNLTISSRFVNNVEIPILYDSLRGVALDAPNYFGT
ncbi:hypothetical protein [Anabaena catenula]|uniref:Uncharacterized protein n=1 Tax=Anabaena catenula FACHB-362 TaxID=2692877 RepID=A0ABR8J4T1_9NOST|nr:hypothetical protein [Anabaena catenula]MBD2693369.1 hypothetical protein [Anabaena catenula FACHB-362]